MKNLNCFCLSIPIPEPAQQELIIYYAQEMGMWGCEEDESKNELKIFFQTQDDCHSLLQQILGLEIKTSSNIIEIPHSDWNKSWKQSLQPVKVTHNIWVAPDWKPPPLDSGEKWIKIEPKMAFGTGHHPSTRLLALAMEKFQYKLRGHPHLDVGSGTGLLNFVACELGSSFSLGIESDIDCLDNIIENASLNSQFKETRFILADDKCLKPGLQFEVITINMIRTLSQPLLTYCLNWLSPTGICIWSGILIEESEKNIQFLKNSPWSLIEELKEDEWWCGILKRSDPFPN